MAGFIVELEIKCLDNSIECSKLSDQKTKIIRLDYKKI